MKIVTEDQPVMIIFRDLLALAAEVEALFGRFHLAFFHHCGDEYAIAPNDGRGPSASWHFDSPRHVFLGAPVVRQARIVETPRESEPRNCGQFAENAALGEDWQMTKATGLQPGNPAGKVAWATNLHVRIFAFSHRGANPIECAASLFYLTSNQHVLDSAMGNEPHGRHKHI